MIDLYLKYGNMGGKVILAKRSIVKGLQTLPK